MDKEQLIEIEWRKFCLACFGDISKQQYIDLRLTFYGGAAALYFILMTALDAGDVPTEADLARMRTLHAEIHDFNEDVKSGKA